MGRIATERIGLAEAGVESCQGPLLLATPKRRSIANMATAAVRHRFWPMRWDGGATAAGDDVPILPTAKAASLGTTDGSEPPNAPLSAAPDALDGGGATANLAATAVRTLRKSSSVAAEGAT